MQDGHSMGGGDVDGKIPSKTSITLVFEGCGDLGSCWFISSRNK